MLAVMFFFFFTIWTTKLCLNSHVSTDIVPENAAQRTHSPDNNFCKNRDKMFQHLRLRYVYGNMEIKQRWLQQIINTNADYFLLFYLFIIHYYHVITELWCKVCNKGCVIITYQYKTMLPHCCWDKYHCKEKTFKVELGSYLITIEYYLT